MGGEPNHPTTGHHQHQHQNQHHHSMVTTTTMALLFLTQYPSIVRGFRPSIIHTFHHPILPITSTISSSSLFSSSTTTTTTNETDSFSATQTQQPSSSVSSSPWTQSQPPPIQTQPKGINKSRFRQHVNPLSRKFQTPTDLPPSWPYHTDGYQDPSLPLHIDVGCGKGGFLLSLASAAATSSAHTTDAEVEQRNYLGLEIRPHVASYARSRLLRRDERIRNCVDFVGCNVNVDLARLLSLYTSPPPSPDDDDTNGERRVGGKIALVSIQFPDPHFKKKHGKRKVVTPEFVEVLAEFLEVGTKVFLQSDIKDVLDGMRETVADGRRQQRQEEIEEGDEGNGSADNAYFVDCNPGTYLKENPIGVPTEREVSVLDKGGEVYRVMFERSDVPYENAE